MRTLLFCAQLWYITTKGCDKSILMEMKLQNHLFKNKVNRKKTLTHGPDIQQHNIYQQKTPAFQPVLLCYFLLAAQQAVHSVNRFFDCFFGFGRNPVRPFEACPVFSEQ